MPKGIPNKKYTGEFKQMVVETMRKELLSYQETARRFEVRSDTQVRSWERIYLEEGPEGLYVERRGRNSHGGGRPAKQLKPMNLRSSCCLKSPGLHDQPITITSNTGTTRTSTAISKNRSQTYFARTKRDMGIEGSPWNCAIVDILSITKRFCV